jgi:hypothetical protein
MLDPYNTINELNLAEGYEDEIHSQNSMGIQTEPAAA